MIFRLQQHVANVFKSLLRGYFATDVDYTWNLNINETKINIFDLFTPRTRKYPLVLVQDITGDAFTKSLNREFQETITGDVFVNGLTRTGTLGYRHGGGNTLNVRITCSAYDPTEARIIADKIDSALRFFIFENFRIEGIEITAIRINSEPNEQIGNDNVHSVDISVSIYCEWEETIDISQSDLLDKIKIPDYEGVIVIDQDGLTNATQGL